MKSAFTRIIAVIVLLALVVTPVAAIDTPQAVGPYPEPDRSAFVPDDTLGTKQLFEAVEPESVLSLDRSDRYVILFEEPSLAAVSKDVQKLDTTTSQSQTYLENLAVQRNQVLVAAERTIGRDLNIIYVYDVILNGVSVELSPDEVQQLAKVDGVRKILPLPDQTLDTDAGPTWIGADGVWDDTAVPDGVGNKGEGLLVGIIDTGINFDHPSFSASPADGFVYEWTGDYLGVCAPEVSGGNPAYAAACNDKLVGAYSYTTEITADVETPEDIEGHGSHTASTVAGNEVEVNFLADTVTISGVAPHAQIIAYDVCYPTPDGNGSCDGPGILAAIEQAVADGVDVINYSISGGENPYGDATELAFLEAFGAGVVVSASGGNSGPDAATVAHRSPWVITTAASTHNRKYHDTVVNFSNPDYQDISTFAGEIPFSTEVLDSPIKYAGEDGDGSNELGCVAFSTDFFTGNIALIKRGDCAFTDKILNAQNAGATGVIIFTNAGDPGGMAVEGTSIPAVMLDVSGTVGDEIATWVTTATDDTVSLTAFYPETNDVYGDIMADFSSRGPNTTFDVLKPDVSAPGVQILAAVSDSTIEPSADYELALYGGTSMSSPHDAGAATLLYAEFPSWSPAMIKSALMLTAYGDMLKEDGITPADPFDMGSGRVDLQKAALTGLVMDETYDNMLAAENGDVSELNIASFYESMCVGECSWTRTFTSVADVDATYTVIAPDWITVEPPKFTIGAGDTQVITVTADVSARTEGEWQFDNILFETSELHSGGTEISDAVIPTAVLPAISNIPDFVTFETHRDADMGTIPNLLASEITAGMTYKSGLVKADLEEISLDPDLTEDDPFDDLSQVYVKTIQVPAYSIRLVAEVTQTTASDVDMFLFWDMDADGVLDPNADYLLAKSATATALEYINAPRDFIYYNADDTFFLVVQNWAGAAGDTITLATGIVPLTPEVGNYSVDVPFKNPPKSPFQIDVYWNEDTEEGDRLYGLFLTCGDIMCDNKIGNTEIDVRRMADDVVKTADVSEALPGDTITYTIEITNYADVATDYTINDVLPAGVTYVPDSVTGGAVYDEDTNAITWSGTVNAPEAPYYNVTDSISDPYCDTGFGGYANLEDFGILATAGISGDTSAWTMGSGPIPYNFYGEDYSAIFFTDDGFVIFDVANNYAGAPWTNQSIPDPAFPNNLAAMLWQDMEIVYDEANNKGVSLATAGDNIDIIEYDDVQIYGDPTSTYDFEVVYYHEVDDTPYYYEIVFAYDNLVGDIDAATIGLENYLGTDAATYAYNDASFSNGHMVCFDLVTPTTTHTITFQATVDTVPDGGLLTNMVLHDNEHLGTVEESAEVTVLITHRKLYLPLMMK